jgi:hypothetical protein
MYYIIISTSLLALIVLEGVLGFGGNGSVQYGAGGGGGYYGGGGGGAFSGGGGGSTFASTAVLELIGTFLHPLN